jgi:hypothetical protein
MGDDSPFTSGCSGPTVNLSTGHCCVMVRRERCTSSVGEIPTRYLSFQPVATGAVVEATKLLKPLVERVV